MAGTIASSASVANSVRALIYLSSSASLPVSASAQTLVCEAQSRNMRNGVTGLLLANSRSYMQLLEGDAADVEDVFGRIREDCRHTSVFTILDRPVPGRAFPNAAMLALDLLDCPIQRRAAIAATIPADACSEVRSLLLAFSVFD